ncbi:hypothetical protein ACH4PU_33835 [Streptomyces sp. NPDC021100]|uniref:hypothetical protein n=1 Tax=Streptomyces sp. NPDC021100 TaxID=3365114 RepID=UPI0037AA673E
MALADRLLTLRRDVHSGEVLARGGDVEAHSILQRTMFVPVARLHEDYHRLPTGLDTSEEIRLATRAVARLRAVGYHVDCDPDFDTEHREPRYLTLGAQVAAIADRIRTAETTEDAADALTELTAAHDGVLDALREVLIATADFYQNLGQGADPYFAQRLRFLADERLGAITSDVCGLRNNLADRHTPHPRRTACEGEVPGDEREASTVCACPAPPPRVASTPAVAAGGRRR